jgi:hypothetical protein
MRNDQEFFQQEFPQMFENVYCGFYLPKGWAEEVFKLCEKLQVINPELRVAEVKVKFSGLRFYVDHDNERARQLITECENACNRLCAYCGMLRDKRFEDHPACKIEAAKNWDKVE